MRGGERKRGVKTPFTPLHTCLLQGNVPPPPRTRAQCVRQTGQRLPEGHRYYRCAHRNYRCAQEVSGQATEAARRRLGCTPVLPAATTGVHLREDRVKLSFENF